MSSTGAGSAAPRCLFVVCNDYGELGVVMNMLAGQQLAERSTILLPPRLYATNRDGLPARVAEYRGLPDIFSVVDRDKPDIVLLLSGYLLPLHRNLSLPDLKALVERLQRRQIVAVTSDPFMSLVFEVDVADTFRIHIPHASWLLRLVARRQTARLVRHLTAAREIFRNVAHLHHVRPMPSSTPSGRLPRRFSFYNDRLITPAPARGDDRPSWLFIISSGDFELQTSLYGEAEFLRILQARLDDARHAGRRAVLIGPERCVDQLRADRARFGLDLMSFCRYDEFARHLLEAEYAFYWNVLSYSNVLRVVNGLPSFSFDVGHMVRNVKPLYARLVEWCYQGAEPTMLDAAERLEPGRLADLAAAGAAGLDRFHASLRESPAPGPMLQQIVHA